jgi:aspartate/methionine/tyrosine aminotransferase
VVYREPPRRDLDMAVTTRLDVAGGLTRPRGSCDLPDHRVMPSQALSELDRLSKRILRSYAAGAVRLDGGDPVFDTPVPIRAAMIKALKAGQTHYGPPLGDPDLRELICALASSRGATSVSVDQVLVTHGAAAALTAAACASLDAGDKVVILDPCYSIFADIVRFAGARPVFVPHGSDLHIDIDAVARAARDAKALIICNPCSPTGIVYTRSELQSLAALAADEDLLVFSDEVYDHIVFDGAEFTSMLEMPELAGRLLYAQSFSKTFAMAGWRIGYLIAPLSLFSACARVHRTINGSINPAVQRGAVAALTMPAGWLRDTLAEYEARRNMVIQAIDRVPGLSIAGIEATFFAWVRHPSTISSDAFVELATQYGVGIRSGAEFGSTGEGHFVLSFSTDKESLHIGLERLTKALAVA